MKVFSTSVEIDAAPETVWGILTDAGKYTEWDPGMESIAGSIASGGQITVRFKAEPRRAFKFAVSDFEPHRGMTWSAGMPLGLFKGVRTFRLESLEGERVRFSMRAEFSGPLLPIFGRTLDLDADFEAFATALKARAEGT